MHIYDGALSRRRGRATRAPADARSRTTGCCRSGIGTSRVVVVQPSTYGTDNRVHARRHGALGRNARGVAVVDTERHRRRAEAHGTTSACAASASTSSDPARRHHRRHDRAARRSASPISAGTCRSTWGEQIVEIEDLLLRLPSPIVFDHLGRIRRSRRHQASGATRSIRKLIDKGRTWVKLSGAYWTPSRPAELRRRDRGGAGLRQGRARAHGVGQRLAAPDQQQEKPDDAVLFDLLADWAPDEATRTASWWRTPRRSTGLRNRADAARSGPRSMQALKSGRGTSKPPPGLRLAICAGLARLTRTGSPSRLMATHEACASLRGLHRPPPIPFRQSQPSASL